MILQLVLSEHGRMTVSEHGGICTCSKMGNGIGMGPGLVWGGGGMVMRRRMELT